MAFCIKKIQQRQQLIIAMDKKDISIPTVDKSQPLLYPWPSMDKYLAKKQQFLTDQSFGQLKAVKENSHLFGIINENQQIEIADGISMFLFGVQNVYYRCGIKEVDAQILIAEKGIKGGHMFGISPESLNGDNPYLIDPYKVGEMVRRKSFNDRVPGNLVGLDYPLLTDVFEFGGVEEADHNIYLLRHKSKGRPALPDNGFGFEYYTGDMEYSALLRKLAYSKHYKTEYYDDLDMLRYQAKQARQEAGY